MAIVEVLPSPDGVPGAVTSDRGLAAETVTISGHDGEQVECHLACPDDEQRHPGIVVIHEAWGVNDHIRDVCARLAAQGYVALAVDLYFREGGPPPFGDVERMMRRVEKLPDERVVGDIAAAVAYLRSRQDATARVGAIGFCMGGRYVLLAACSGAELDAAADCWGGFIERSTPDELSTPERPVPPITLVPRLECPLMAAIGAEDTNPSPALGAQLGRLAIDAGKDVEVDVYDGAGHAFFADYRPTYRPQPAQLLWTRIVPFFGRHLRDAAG